MATPAAVLNILVNAQTRQAQSELRRMDRTVGQTARNAQEATKGVDRMQASVRSLGDETNDTNTKLARFSRQVQVTRRSAVELGGAIGKTNRNFTFLRNAVASLKWPAIVAGAGAAAQALGAAGAAAVALTGALAPLTGLLVAYPALLGALGQGLGVVALGFGEVAKALGGNEEAMKRLTDRQKQFVEQLKDLKPRLNELKDAAGEGLFEGLNTGLRRAIRNFPVLEGVVRRTGNVMGGLAAEAGRLVGSRGFGRDFERIGNQNADVIDRLGRGGLNLADALRHVIVAAQPFVDWLTRTVAGFTQVIAAQAKAGRESGAIARFFQMTRETLEVVTPMAYDFARALLNIAMAGRPLGMDILRSLREGAAAFREWTESAAGQNQLQRYFENARPAIFEAGRLIRDITVGVAQLGAQPGFEEVIRKVRTDLLPILLNVVKTTNQALTPALVDLAVAFARAFHPILGASGPVVALVRALTALFNVIGDLVESSPIFQSAMANVVGAVAAFKLAKLLAIVSGFRALGSALGLVGGGAAATGGAAAGGGVLKGIIDTFKSGAAAGGVAGGLKALFSKAAPIAGRVGAIGLGVTVATQIVSAMSQQIRQQGVLKVQEAFKELNREARGGSFVGEMIESVFGKSDASKNAERLEKALRGIARSQAGISSDRAEELNRALNRMGGISDSAREAFRRLIDSAVERGQRLRIVQNEFGRLRTGAVTNVRDMREVVDRNMDRIRESIGFNSRRGQELVRNNFQAAVGWIRENMSRGGRLTDRGMNEIRRLIQTQMRAAQMGAKGNLDEIVGAIRSTMRRGKRVTDEGMDLIRQAFINELKLYGVTSARALVMRPQEGAAQRAMGRQRGGPIDRGRASGDSVPALLEKGEYVLNRNAVKKIGERQLDAVNFGAAKRFQRGGGIRMPRGGFPDAMGALSGLDALAWVLKQKFGLNVVSGLRPGAVTTSGNPSDHGWGGAIDVSNGSQPTPQMDAAANWLAKAGGFTFHPGVTSGGPIKQMLYRTFIGGNHFNHIHVALQRGIANNAKAVLQWLKTGGGAAGLMGMMAPIRIPGVELGGPESPLREIVQAGLDRTRRAAQNRAERLAGTGDIAAGVSGAPQRMARQMLQRMGWGNQWPALLELWNRESGWDPNAVNPSSGAYGIPQALPSAHGRPYRLGDAKTQIAWGLRYIKNRYPSGPREALAFHDSHNWYREGGMVGMARGGEAIKMVDHVVGMETFGKEPALRRQMEQTLQAVSGSDKKKVRQKALKGLLKRIRGIEIPNQERISELQALTAQQGEFAERALALSTQPDTASLQGLPVETLRAMAGAHLGSMTPRQRSTIEFSGRTLDQLDENAALEILDTPVWGQVGGSTQVEWLEKQLETLRILRNALIRAEQQIVERRNRVIALIEAAQKRLNEVADQIRQAAKTKRRLEAALEKVRNLSGAKAPEKARQIVRELRGDVPAGVWNQLNRAVEGDRPAVALRRELRQQIDRVEGNQRPRARERDALENQIIPALVGRRNALTEALTQEVQPSLAEVQGQVADDVKSQVFAKLPDLGVLGGQIFDVQMSIRDLGVKKILSVPQPEAAEAAQDTETAELLRQLLREANLRTAVSERQFDVFKNFPPFGGEFATGGMVPGPIGAPRMILAHGGETITPPGDVGGVTVVVNGDIMNVPVGRDPVEVLVNDRRFNAAVEKAVRPIARGAGRMLPSGGGGLLR